MKTQLTKYLKSKSRNFLRNEVKTHKCLFHASPHLLKKRGTGKQTIEIDAFKEELFPTRRSHLLYQEELGLSDKIRSARIAKRNKLREIETQKHANLIFELLSEALHNNRLKKATVSWEYLEWAPKFICDTKDNYELDNYVQIDLIDVGFEIIGVTMPNHRQYCVIWWKHNHLCKLNGGTKVIDKVLELYRNTLRAIISRKMALKMTPRLIFRMANDTNNKENENIIYHKQKMDYLVENALIEEYQKYLGIEFKREDNEQEQKYKNEQFHDVLMNQIYGDWRYDKNGNEIKGFNGKRERNKIQNKWIETFLTKVSGNKLTPVEKDMIKKRRKEKHGIKKREKAVLLNRILSSDPGFIEYVDGVIDDEYVNYNRKTRDILKSFKEKQNDVIIENKASVRDKMMSKKTHIQTVEIIRDGKDLDLVGFVE